MGVSKFGGPFIPIPKWVMNYLTGDSVAVHVLVNALCYLDNDTQELTTSYEHLAKVTGCSRRTVIRAMSRLHEVGVVQLNHRHGKRGKQLTNKYTIDFNSPLSQTRGVTSDTPPLRGVTSDTPPVSPQTPLRGVTSDTQSRKTNLKQDRPKGRGVKGELDLFSTDPKWQQQLKKTLED